MKKILILIFTILSLTSEAQVFPTPTDSKLATEVITTTSTVTEWNKFVSVSASGATTINLPTAVGNAGKQIVFKRTDATTNVVTIAPFGSQTIDGLVGLNLAPEATITIYSDGTNSYTTNGQSIAGEDVASVYAVVNVTPSAVQNSPSTSAQFMSITIPSAGTWNVEWSVYAALWNGVNAGNAAHISSGLFDNTGTLIPNSELVSGSANIGSSLTASSGLFAGTRSFTVTTTGPTTYNVKVWNQNSNAFAIALSNTNGRSYIKASKVSGFTPITGNTVDYVSVRRTASNQTGVVLNTDVIYNSISTGNIPYNTSTGVFTLTAGKTYDLFASAKIRNDGTGTTGRYAQFEWVDAITNTALSGLKQGVSIMSTSVLNESGTDNAGGIYTPNTNQTVKVRITGIDGSNIELDQGRTSATITQIGSTSNTVGTLPANDQSAAGFFDVGNMRIAWGKVLSVSDNDEIVTFSAPFAVAPTVSANIEVSNGGNYTASLGVGTTGFKLATTTGFTFNRDDSVGAIDNPFIHYIAIGIKP